MPTIEVDHISKSFASIRAVDDVSFSVGPGEIFGLLGPNGAGKTTSLRIILDIFKADSGTVKVFGGEMTEVKKDRIGYLPEERGLYQDITLERCLKYLASLKGLSAAETQKRMDAFLTRFELSEYRRKKVKELSKGMQQKAQLIAALIHQPDLVIIDEPFAALDPINTQMVKDLLRDLRNSGATIVMCTHQMHQAEELCDRMVLINRGRSILYGTLNEIRRQFTRPEVLVRTESALPQGIPGVAEIVSQNSVTRLKLASGVSPQDVLTVLVNNKVIIEQFEIAMPTLDEIFINVVKGSGPGE